MTTINIGGVSCANLMTLGNTNAWWSGSKIHQFGKLGKQILP